jgi:predicted nucleic acid-binding protein
VVKEAETVRFPTEGWFPMASVYVETTIVSYLTASRSRDLVVAAKQQITRDWWQVARTRFDLFLSEVVLAEIRAGDPAEAVRRLEAVKGLPCLDLSPEVYLLANTYRQQLGLPEKAAADVMHIAVAVAYELDYLVTWNCAHIANGYVLRRLMKVNAGIGRFTPLLLTPEELVEPLEGEST